MAAAFVNFISMVMSMMRMVLEIVMVMAVVLAMMMVMKVTATEKNPDDKMGEGSGDEGNPDKDQS